MKLEKQTDAFEYANLSRGAGQAWAASRALESKWIHRSRVIGLQTAVVVASPPVSSCDDTPGLGLLAAWTDIIAVFPPARFSFRQPHNTTYIHQLYQHQHPCWHSIGQPPIAVIVDLYSSSFIHSPPLLYCFDYSLSAINCLLPARTPLTRLLDPPLDHPLKPGTSQAIHQPTSSNSLCLALLS